jgi:dipeptidyl aminopeptidase/acylaminoacyl peptidase
MGKRIAIAALAAVLWLLQSPSAAAAARVDIDALVGDDVFTSIKLSPTGEYYAMTAPVGDQTGLAVMRRSDGKLTATLRFRGGTHVDDFWWVNDERILLSVAESFGSRDEPVPTGELYAINADGSRRELLVGWRVHVEQTATKIKSHKREEFVAAYLIDPLPTDPEHVLVAVHPIIRDPSTRVERMNVYNGRRVRVASAPVSRATFVTDNAGVIRFAGGTGTDNVSRLYYRSDNAAEWELVNDQRQTGRIESALGFSENGESAYLKVSQSEGPDAIVALDVASGVRQEVLRDGIVDPHPVFRDGWGTPIGVRFLGPEPRLAFFDEDSVDARLYRKLEEAFPGHAISIPASTKDGRLKLVMAWSDVEPGSFYMFDTTTNKAEFVLARRQKIDPADMAVMKAVSVRARDGLQLHGFLITPASGDGRNLPLVVMPHGGPFGIFDRWGFESDTQLLASAGYAVLRINFRGSGNYGQAFREAGAQQWGGTMQDDLTDATRWAIAEGIADPGRICIYGASYGGYAALMGVAKEPDLYRCAVGYVGVYDLPRMRTETSRVGRWATQWSREWVGDDNARLASSSPTRLASRIKVPVFLAAGGKDQVAPIEHSRMMERALADAGVPVETLYYPTEGHGFHGAANRREFYTRLLDFLGRHFARDGAAAL